MGPWQVGATDQRSLAGVAQPGSMTQAPNFVADNPPWAASNAAPPAPAQPRPAEPAPVGRARQAAPAAAATETGAGSRKAKSARRAGRRKRLGRLVIVVVVVAVAGAGAAVYKTLPSSGGGPAHSITNPDRLGDYTQATALGTSLKIAQLRDSIVSSSRGEAKNVVDNVYQDGNQILLFIGGNLTGTTSGSFISSFIGSSPDAVTTSAGSLGGSAACLPSVSGHPAECAWADDDTFGVVLSPTLTATQLASEMRAMRPMVEHPVK
jgi:hypothetical protein